MSFKTADLKNRKKLVTTVDTLESELEIKLNKCIKRLGGISLKWTSPGTAGVPDRIVFMPNGRVLFVELKTETGKLTRLQNVMITRLRRLGQDVRVVHGERELDALLEELAAGL